MFSCVSGRHRLLFYALAAGLLLYAILCYAWTISRDRTANPTSQVVGASESDSAAAISVTAPSSRDVDFMAQVLQKSKGQNICLPQGEISDTCIDFQSVEAVNRKLRPLLRRLVRTRFFRTLKVDLYRPCELWNSEGSCFQPNCIVKPLEDDTVPDAWKVSTVDNFDSSPFSRKLITRHPIPEFSDRDFVVVSDEAYGDGIWVDLQDNPERFTGYAGPEANRVWETIYNENCFGVAPLMRDTASGWGNQQTELDGTRQPFVAPPKHKGELVGFLKDLGFGEDSEKLRRPSVPLEIRSFYRLISGFHASVSTHICYNYLNHTTNHWERNLGCFISRIGAFPDRLQNIYFDYVVLLSSIKKMAHYLENYNYSTGSPKRDKTTQRLIKRILRVACESSISLEEDQFFAGSNGPALKEDFKASFRNISRVMDCTGCEKCRLWGKTQTMGLGTALKALFSYPARAFGRGATSVSFKRNEIVSLFNTMHQFTTSIEAIGGFREMYQDLLVDYQLKNDNGAGPALPERDEL